MTEERVTIIAFVLKNNATQISFRSIVKGFSKKKEGKREHTHTQSVNHMQLEYNILMNGREFVNFMNVWQFIIIKASNEKRREKDREEKAASNQSSKALDVISWEVD